MTRSNLHATQGSKPPEHGLLSSHLIGSVCRAHRACQLPQSYVPHHFPGQPATYISPHGYLQYSILTSLPPRADAASHRPTALDSPSKCNPLPFNRMCYPSERTVMTPLTLPTFLPLASPPVLIPHYSHTCSLIARISLAPIASPDGSPASKKTLGRRRCATGQQGTRTVRARASQAVRRACARGRGSIRKERMWKEGREGGDVGGWEEM